MVNMLDTRLLVTHLTRMDEGRFCAAGVGVSSEKHIRPVPRNQGGLPGSIMAGVFQLGGVVHLGPTKDVGLAPEVEDHEFEGKLARMVGAFVPADFWNRLRCLARPALATIFGNDFYTEGRHGFVDEGKGNCSLGYFVPLRENHLQVKYDVFGGKPGKPGKPSKPRIRAVLQRVGGSELNLAVNDLRFHEEKPWGWSLRERAQEQVELINHKIADGVPCVLAVGLTRPWARESDLKPRHWLQVNNIYYEDDPLWRI